MSGEAGEFRDLFGEEFINNLLYEGLNEQVPAGTKDAPTCPCSTFKHI